MSEQYLSLLLIDSNRVGNDDPNLDDYAIANIKEADPMTCMFSLAKALVVNGTIRSCPGHLDLSSCRRSFSRFELFRIACSLIYLKTLTFFSRRPNGKDACTHIHMHMHTHKEKENENSHSLSTNVKPPYIG